jgi:hypothetical protein
MMAVGSNLDDPFESNADAKQNTYERSSWTRFQANTVGDAGIYPPWHNGIDLHDGG